MNRRVINIVDGIQTSDGAGVKLRRIIGSPDLNMLDPFLLFDEFGSDNPDDYIAGFPPHPHRGFETITYMLNGKFKHKDSAGNEGLLSDGSVQWMTAGRGVIHSEMPEKTDGLARGFQLWLNLPKKLKMIDPFYNDIPSEQIPSVDIVNGRVRIISGTYEGVTGPGSPHTGMLYFDVELNKATNIEIPISNMWNTFIYVYEGEALTGKHNISEGQLAVFNQEGILSFGSSESSALKCIVASGEPLNEPVARGGPFVMNNRAEVLQAFDDYQKGVLDK
jgi:redox-sensitive bicupin YhaK (pirin superfamily)